MKAADASAIARELGIDDFHAEVLPEDKARYIQDEQAQGRRCLHKEGYP